MEVMETSFCGSLGVNRVDFAIHGVDHSGTSDALRASPRRSSAVHLDVAGGDR